MTIIEAIIYGPVFFIVAVYTYTVVDAMMFRYLGSSEWTIRGFSLSLSLAAGLAAVLFIGEINSGAITSAPTDDPGINRGYYTR